MMFSGKFTYRIETEPSVLELHLSAIRAIGDAEKDALGFIPEGGLREAIYRRRLFAMVARDGETLEIAGYILFGGVFPSARVLQIAVSPSHRRSGVASALISSLVTYLEKRGYIDLTAAIASNLPDAQAFYERNGFIERRTRAGGQARQRTIIVRARNLDTKSLLSLMSPSNVMSSSVADLGLRHPSAFEAPLYVFDLNVLFDLIRDRARSDLANHLFSAALSHMVRLAVAPEFIVELERSSRGEAADPTLSLARQLPRLPSFPKIEVDTLAADIHRVVFEDKKRSQAGRPQALSDARHLAEAALSRAVGYITSDEALLNSRDEILEMIGVDVAGLDEFVHLLPTPESNVWRNQLQGTECETKSASIPDAKRYLVSQQVSEEVIREFCPSTSSLSRPRTMGVFENGEIVGLSIYQMPPSVNATGKLLVHVRPDHVVHGTFVEHLLDDALYEACTSGPITIELKCGPGQSATKRTAQLRGFLPTNLPERFIKIAMGRPLTPATWDNIIRQTRRRTGLELPDYPRDTSTLEFGVLVRRPDGTTTKVSLSSLEDALSPTLIIWPSRDGVIAPITKTYADDLLGTAEQFPLFGRPRAAFVGSRTYFNSPRTMALMRPGAPILFYESWRSGGRAAIVAAGRIVDAVVILKSQVPDDLRQRAVVEDLEPLTASSDVLATTFDNLIRFPTPVRLDTLRALGAEGTSNLQRTTALPNALLAAILDLGWSGA
ncbi:MAG: GNAT family N-acetyltransferase [Rhodoplanes sp.]|uniref:GNAT family N-acetyltransferase n=1 Tax=Rhodoplanes sp. TaxID=1968906 RepID=UPI001799D10B|nr:GNAT family N-acetyltransferase [Rhodoplanes sp.]NVO12973.1 GNAT family N-acetyltransferase [Rhodoplanes sp.]